VIWIEGPKFGFRHFREEWNPGELTKSGYAYIVKRVVRGQPLSAAVEVFRGAPTDELPSAAETLTDGTGHRLTTISRGVTFFESKKSKI
jgi:prolyl oligopeptidase